VIQSSSASRSVGRGKEDVLGHLAVRNHTNCVDLWRLSKSTQSHQVQLSRLCQKSTYINHRTGIYCFAQTHNVHLRQLLLPEISSNLRNEDQGTDAWHTCTQRPYDHWFTKWMIRTKTVQRWHIHKHPTSSGKKQSNTTKNAIATKHRSPDFCLPPTAIQTKPVIKDKDQQTREWVEMDFSITAQIPEMDFS